MFSFNLHIAFAVSELVAFAFIAFLSVQHNIKRTAWAQNPPAHLSNLSTYTTVKKCLP